MWGQEVYHFNEEPHFKDVSTSLKCTTSVINLCHISIIKIELVSQFFMGQGPTIMSKAGIQGWKYSQYFWDNWCDAKEATDMNSWGWCSSLLKKEICAKRWKNKRTVTLLEIFQNGQCILAEYLATNWTLGAIIRGDLCAHLNIINSVFWYVWMLLSWPCGKLIWWVQQQVHWSYAGIFNLARDEI